MQPTIGMWRGRHSTNFDCGSLAVRVPAPEPKARFPR
jgi:hypothetical protein